MAKPKETADAVSSNPMQIEWPFDPHGASSALKQAITAASGNMNGNDEKLAILLKVMELGFEHIKARYKSQVQENRESMEWRAQISAEAKALSTVKGYQA
jgi:hypothetical protein